MKFETKLACFV